MHKTLTIALAASLLALSSCQKQIDWGGMPRPKANLKTMSLTLSAGQVHNQVLDGYFTKYGINPDSSLTRAEYNEMIEDMSTVVDSLYGDEFSDYFLARGLVTFDELGAFENGVLNTSSVVENIISSEEHTGIQDILSAVHYYSSADEMIPAIEDLVEGTDIPNSQIPAVQAYMSVLTNSYEASKKRPVKGIGQTPQYPLKSHNEKVADWDGAGFKNEFSVAIREGDLYMATMRASMVAALFSAVKERELRAKGE